MPKSFTIQFLFIFSNFIGIKMHGREARVSTLEMRTKTPGRWVIVGSDWRERLHPCGPFPWGEVASHVSILPSECSVSLSLYALFLFSHSCIHHFSLFIIPCSQAKIRSLTLLGCIYYKVDFSWVLNGSLLLKLYFFINDIDFVIEGCLSGFSINASSELSCKCVNPRMYRLYRSIKLYFLFNSSLFFLSPQYTG